MNPRDRVVGSARPGVLLVTDVYPPGCGGSGWSTHALAMTLRTNGHAVRVVELDGGTRRDTRREYDGVPITSLAVGAARRSVRSRLGAHDYAFVPVRDHVTAVLREDASLRIVHGQHLHSAPGAIAAARRERRAAVVTLRDHWPVCLHGTAWWGGGECDGCTSGNLVGCMRENFAVPALVARALIPWARRRLATRVVDISQAHRVVAVSATLRDRIQARAGDVLKITVVPNIVDHESSRAAAESIVGQGDPTAALPDRYLLAAGKLTAVKGFESLLEALSSTSVRLPLVVAGEGPLRRHLHRRAGELGVEAIFLGWVDSAPLLRLMQKARAVLLPSLWEEPLSRVLLEAMSLGVPVISWAVGSSREVIEHGVNGWLVRRPQDLGDCLRQLQSDEVRDRVAAAAAATARELFAPDVVYAALSSVYAAALKQVEYE